MNGLKGPTNPLVQLFFFQELDYSLLTYFPEGLSHAIAGTDAAYKPTLMIGMLWILMA
jgi:hypothetical protein